MVKRSGVDVCCSPRPCIASPGLKEAPVLDLMCSHFVLTLAAKQGAQVQRAARPERPAVAGRPPSGLAGAGAGSACANSSAAAARATSSGAATSSCRRSEFLDRHGVWRGPYEEGTLFFYLDEYAKDQPKDLLSVLAVTRRLADARAEEAVHPGRKEHRCAGRACCS